MDRSHIGLMASLGVTLLLAGCGGAGTDKAGGAAAGEVRVLRLANANGEPAELEPYARAVERASNGRLRIEFVNDWRKGEPNAEPGILDDVRAEKVDLAWVGARAFKAEGVSALDPLVAPFAVTDYATEEKVLASPIAGAMLDAVDTAGVRGVAILPGPLQRLGMREPWHSARDLRGKRIGAPAGIGGLAVEALGARPVAFASGDDLTRVDGSAQLHLAAYLGASKDLVVFETFGHGGAAQNIATVPATCPTLAMCTKRIRYLTANAPDGLTNSTNPAWAPDGSRIAVAEWTFPAPGDTSTDWYADIFTIDANGRDRRRVSTSADWDMRPNWGVTPRGRPRVVAES